MSVPTRLPEGVTHVEYLLDEALVDIRSARLDVAVTHLAQALLMVRADTLPDERLHTKAVQVIAEGGGFR